MKRLLIMLLLVSGVAQAQSNNTLEAYKTILVTELNPNTLTLIIDMVVKDASDSSLDQKFYNHSKMVLPKKRVRKFLSRARGASHEGHDHSAHKYEFESARPQSTGHGSIGHVCDEKCH